MHTFCDCKDFIKLLDQDRKMFIEDPIYGVVLLWTELTEEKGYTQVHRYGVPILFCPMCGKPLRKNV